MDRSKSKGKKDVLADKEMSLQRAEKILNPFSTEWRARWREMRISFPVRVILTKGGELFVDITHNAPGYPLPSTLWTKLLGPIDPEGDIEKQLEGVGPLMAVSQTREEMYKEIEKMDALEKVFAEYVELKDFKSNFKEAFAAMKAGDMDAFRKLCPDATDCSFAVPFDYYLERKGKDSL